MKKKLSSLWEVRRTEGRGQVGGLNNRRAERVAQLVLGTKADTSRLKCREQNGLIRKIIEKTAKIYLTYTFAENNSEKNPFNPRTWHKRVSMWNFHEDQKGENVRERQDSQRKNNNWYLATDYFR